MNKKNLIIALAAATLTAGGAQAQATKQDKTDLNKVITLEREFDPVKKTVVKKTVLPKEIKKSSKQAVAPQFSDWTVPTLVPVEIPTMLPYGYRTRHNFSNQRGYLDLGAGTHLNMSASAGYRAIDEEKEQLGIWLQHNSSWLGKNTSKLIEQPSQRQKQHFNDNLVGADWNKQLSTGLLGVDARLHFDSFNYYGGFNNYLKNNKTAFFEARADAKWKSDKTVGETTIDYEANATLDYAGYDKSHLEGIDGSKELWLRASLEGQYELNDNSDAGLLFGGDVVNLHRHNEFTNKASDHTYGVIRLAPYYHYVNSVLDAKAGANLDLSLNDGTAFRLSPNIDLNFKIHPGVNLFARAEGGKTINHLGAMHDEMRYNDPLAQYGNTYVPFDGKVGFNVGPFSGFDAKVYVGYGFMTGCLDAVVPAANSGIYKEVLDIENPNPDGISPYTDGNQYAANIFKMTKYKGAYVGLEAKYKYRSLAEARVSFAYAPQSDDPYEDGTRYSGYALGWDGASTLLNIDVTAWPIKPLMVTAGLSFRGNRSVFTRQWVEPETLILDGVAPAPGHYTYDSLDMNDVVDLHVSARYSFSHKFAVWAQAGNLLCKQWDIMPGQGAQKINLMGGISLNF